MHIPQISSHMLANLKILLVYKPFFFFSQGFLISLPEYDKILVMVLLVKSGSDFLGQYSVGWVLRRKLFQVMLLQHFQTRMVSSEVGRQDTSHRQGRLRVTRKFEFFRFIWAHISPFLVSFSNSLSHERLENCHHTIKCSVCILATLVLWL